jgi:hypothetical protein
MLIRLSDQLRDNYGGSNQEPALAGDAPSPNQWCTCHKPSEPQTVLTRAIAALTRIDAF